MGQYVPITGPNGLAKMILKGKIQGRRRKVRQKKTLEYNISEWTERNGEKCSPDHVDAPTVF